jgi:hypothetical protein
MLNMTRLKKFTEAMNEYGKVIETFCNSSQFVLFIWVSLNHFINIIAGIQRLAIASVELGPSLGVRAIRFSCQL